MARYIVTTLYKDGIRQTNQYNNKDCAIGVFLLGINNDNIVKSVKVYDSIKRSVILDSKKHDSIAKENL